MVLAELSNMRPLSEMLSTILTAQPQPRSRTQFPLSSFLPAVPFGYPQSYSFSFCFCVSSPCKMVGLSRNRSVEYISSRVSVRKAGSRARNL